MEAVTRITGEQHVSLADVDPEATGGLLEEEADRQLPALRSELRELHDLMMAAETHALLVILQGMDASGKDVTIENVFSAMNPSAVRVKAFKPLAGEEVKHHFLWRANAAMPMYGEVVIFDRSYYEQLIRPHLDGDVAEAGIRQREEHIKVFERMHVEAGTQIIKIFLHIDKDVQEQRLEERQGNIGSAWKISATDWSDRDDWDTFMAAYERSMNASGTPDVPWYVVPANHPWFHNVAVARILLERLRPFEQEWEEARRKIGEENRTEAEEARQQSESARG